MFAVNPGVAAATFPTTHWSVIVRAGQPDSPDAAVALGRLYENYAYPVYCFLRRRGQSPDDARDVVQEIFLALLERNQLASVVPEKGRFRSYLLSAVNHLLTTEWRKQHRQKRGGGAAALELDALSAEERYRLEPVDGRAPDVLYGRRWALDLLDRVFRRLRGECETAGRGESFDVLRAFLSGDMASPSYAEVAGELGLTEGAARVAVHRLRQRYRDLLREEIAQTVDDPAEVEDELRSLLSALRS